MDKSLLRRVLVEFIGTFIFLGVIVVSTYESLHYIEKAFAVGIALTVAILFGGNISGGYFNPAVSIMMLFKKEAKNGPHYGYVECILYIIAQVLGGICAYFFLR
jgi:glycerol uptake facilitator-like aquaporin